MKLFFIFQAKVCNDFLIFLKQFFVNGWCKFMTFSTTSSYFSREVFLSFFNGLLLQSIQLCLLNLLISQCICQILLCILCICTLRSYSLVFLFLFLCLEYAKSIPI
ncbi:hypothetical protein FGO68_gene13574 [Halteria grandinella]|uniref:Uncharacterized protein n=1 Tax=Halteria grandinella TaxID=5974 RepID=A0A8J8NY39_HALGN|nr:hypothetical protein FGO68_gene13574 [Halteria grandinella]